MKLGLDIGNSTVKGAMLSEDNELLANIKYPSAVVQIPDAKYVDFPYEEDFYIQVVDSALEHFNTITAIGDKAINMPGYQEYDVTSTSYKANNPITTALMFGAIAQNTDEEVVHVKLAVTVPIVEAKTIGLIQEYKDLLTGTHVVMVFTQDGIRRLEVHIDTAVVMNEGQAGFLGMLDTVDAEFRETLNHVYKELGEDEELL